MPAEEETAVEATGEEASEETGKEEASAETGTGKSAYGDVVAKDNYNLLSTEDLDLLTGWWNW